MQDGATSFQPATNLVLAGERAIGERIAELEVGEDDHAEKDASQGEYHYSKSHHYVRPTKKHHDSIHTVIP